MSYMVGYVLIVGVWLVMLINVVYMVQRCVVEMGYVGTRGEIVSFFF